MFTYSRVRTGDGIMVVYNHESTFDPAQYDEHTAQSMAFAILQSLMFSRSADRAEFSFDGYRVTIERENVCTAWNDTGCTQHSWDQSA